MEMTLPQAIEGLYAAFADCPRPRLVADPYGLQAGEVRRLLIEPVRTFSPGLLSSFLSHPDECHSSGLKFALPRLLELLAGGAEFWMLPLRSVSLTPPQQAALHTFALAWLREMLAERRCPLDDLADPRRTSSGVARASRWSGNFGKARFAHRRISRGMVT